MSYVIREFACGLPIPPLNRVQEKLVGEIVRLENLCRVHEIKKSGASRELWEAWSCFVRAMDQAGRKRDEYGDCINEDDDPEANAAYSRARAPFRAVESWIRVEGSGTGSARVLAISYIVKILRLDIDLRQLWDGTLDSERKSLARSMMAATNPPNLPPVFWQIFVDYRETTAAQMEGSK